MSMVESGGDWGDCSSVIDEMLGKDFSLVDLNDQAGRVQQEGAGKREIATAVKEIAIKNVVDAGEFAGGEEGWQRDFLAGEKRAEIGCGLRIVDVDAEKLNSVGGEF